MEEICHVDANHAFVVSELKCKVKELEDKLVAIHWHVQRIADHE